MQWQARESGWERNYWILILVIKGGVHDPEVQTHSWFRRLCREVVCTKGFDHAAEEVSQAGVRERFGGIGTKTVGVQVLGWGE